MLSVRAHVRILKTTRSGAALVAALAIWASASSAQTLQGSRASMDRQVRAAKQHDFTFIDTPERVRFFADQGWLIRIESTRDFIVKNDVRYPYARPEVQLFAERLGRQYRQACGEQLVVTSLTRPTTRQPRNASSRSVHPTGMALDLRYSWNRSCREWLQGVLASLERQGVLEATLERNPRHYHVALFPKPYAAYVEARLADDAETRYFVRQGDSLWKIARKHGTTVEELRTANDLRGSRIYAGQVLTVPGR